MGPPPDISSAVAPETTRWQLVLPGSPDSPAAARHAVLERLGDRTRSGDLALLVSEAVTNAVRHGGGADGADIVVQIQQDEDAVEIRVLDGGHGTPRQRAGGANGGYGLQLVDTLSESWSAGSGVLWFRLRLL